MKGKKLLMLCATCKRNNADLSGSFAYVPKDVIRDKRVLRDRAITVLAGDGIGGKEISRLLDVGYYTVHRITKKTKEVVHA